ncbi:MAG TPA: citrate/2-methylcitrate synthase, partial [Actinomycetota bacterium]
MADAAGKGLEGVVAAQTRISDVDGRRGRLFYAGYDIADLAAHATFEETIYLLHHLELPTADELARSVATLRAESVLDPLLVELIGSLAQRTGPMTTLRTAVSAAAALDPEDDAPEANLGKAYRLMAKTPQMIATYQRLRTGADAIEPRDDLGMAANFLYALTGKQPDPQVARDFDVVLVLYADHTLNASTFAGRVAAATLADMYAAATAAVATLQGPLHGGAIEEVREMLEEIGAPDRAPDWVRARLAAKQKIMGFGHRVYKTWDPRATVLREIAERLGRQFGETRWYETSVRVQETVMEEKALYPNVDFYTGTIYAAMGIPSDLFTCMFAVSR